MERWRPEGGEGDDHPDRRDFARSSEGKIFDGFVNYVRTYTDLGEHVIPVEDERGAVWDVMCLKEFPARKLNELEENVDTKFFVPQENSSLVRLPTGSTARNAGKLTDILRPKKLNGQRIVKELWAVNSLPGRVRYLDQNPGKMKVSLVVEQAVKHGSQWYGTVDQVSYEGWHQTQIHDSNPFYLKEIRRDSKSIVRPTRLTGATYEEIVTAREETLRELIAESEKEFYYELE
jgi:primosomal protein N'